MTVASFACACGFQDEVLEPAPQTLVCGEKGCGLTMHRWTPKHPPPPGSARRATESETCAIPQVDLLAANIPPKIIPEIILTTVQPTLF